MDIRILGNGRGHTAAQDSWLATYTTGTLPGQAARRARALEAARIAAKQPVVTGPVYPSCPIRNWRQHTLTLDPLIDAEGCSVTGCGVPYIVAYGTRTTAATANTQVMALCYDHAAVFAAMMGYRWLFEAAEGLLYRECAGCGNPVADPEAVSAEGPGYWHADCLATRDMGLV